MKLSDKHIIGLGCLGELVVLAVGLVLLKNADANANALAYLTVLAGPYFFVRWFLNKFDLWSPVVGAVAGPLFVLGCFLLAQFVPLSTEKKPGEGEKAEKDAIAESASADVEVPPGIRYTAASTNEVTVEAALAELDGLVGLAPVKAEVKRFAKFVQVAQQRKAKGLKVAPISYHMVFTGNPGTGKTTVARIMAKIYKALGVVKMGHLVECDRGALVAGYEGQTAIKTGKVIDFALDGILFVDEAYSLVNGSNDSYGDEVVSTLLKRMEDDRDRLVVIVAGYTEEMKRFIDANSGLASRFTHYVEFPDYTAEELAAMFRMNAKKNQYVLSPDVEKWLDAFVRVRTAKRDRKFGNGRWARTLFENAVSRQAVRVGKIENPTPEQLKTLTMNDVGIKLKDPDASKED